MTQRFNTPGHAHELTISTNQKESFFLDDTACKLMLDSISKSKEKFGFHLWAYVVMPDHVHILLWPNGYQYDIGKIQQSINGLMSRRYSRLLLRVNPQHRAGFLETGRRGSVFKFWQKGGGFDRNFFTPKAIHNCIRYIEKNPVCAKLVSHANEYPWSSAWYSSTKEKWRPLVDRETIPFRLS